MVMIGEANLETDYLKRIPDVSKVRASIKMNDIVIDWLSFEIYSTDTHASDTFHIEAPLYEQTNESMLILLETTSIKVEIAIDDGTGSLVRMLLGYVDDYEIDPLNGYVFFTGRDLTSLFIDTKVIDGSTLIKDLTSSGVAIAYAGEHGLKMDITNTDTKVGVWDGSQTVYISAKDSEWDLLCKLAQNEDFDVYVIDDTLHFKPKTTTKDYYRINFNYADESGFEASNALRLRCSRNLTIASDIKVVGQNWDILNQKKNKVTSSRKRSSKTSRDSRSKTQTYYVNTIGQNPNGTAQVTQSLQKQLSAHQRKISMTLIGDTVLTNRSVMKLTGVGPIFDQLYYPDSIKRSMSFDEPFLMEVTAKNHDVKSQVS